MQAYFVVFKICFRKLRFFSYAYAENKKFCEILNKILLGKFQY